MLRLAIVTILLLVFASTASLSDNCEKYKFGSSEWWSCKQRQSPGGR